jgi:hypothetical protein
MLEKTLSNSFAVDWALVEWPPELFLELLDFVAISILLEIPLSGLSDSKFVLVPNISFSQIHCSQFLRVRALTKPNKHRARLSKSYRQAFVGPGY